MRPGPSDPETQSFVPIDRGRAKTEGGPEQDLRKVAPRAAAADMLFAIAIETTKSVNVGGFTSGQKHFLDFHRNAVLLQTIRK
jgi:hypothetical protein